MKTRVYTVPGPTVGAGSNNSLQSEGETTTTKVGKKELTQRPCDALQPFSVLSARTFLFFFFFRKKCNSSSFFVRIYSLICTQFVEFPFLKEHK